MIYLIVGTPDSGKSNRAETIVCELNNKYKYYVATMIPYKEEGRKRVEKHRKMREGKGFITLELPYDISRAADEISDATDSVVLLECVSNLVANLYFDRRFDRDTVINQILKQVKTLSDKAGNLVIVTNEFDDRLQEYDEETLEYIHVMKQVNQELITISNKVEVMGK